MATLSFPLGFLQLDAHGLLDPRRLRNIGAQALDSGRRGLGHPSLTLQNNKNESSILKYS